MVGQWRAHASCMYWPVGSVKLPPIGSPPHWGLVPFTARYSVLTHKWFSLALYSAWNGQNTAVLDGTIKPTIYTVYLVHTFPNCILQDVNRCSLKNLREKRNHRFLLQPNLTYLTIVCDTACMNFYNNCVTNRSHCSNFFYKRGTKKTKVFP
jgi:hypothetical protein